MIEASNARLFIPDGLKGFKQGLFEDIGRKMGGVIRGDIAELEALPDNLIPVIGCTPALRPAVRRWRAIGRKFIYWDRGYARRVFATWLPRADTREESYYRWHINAFQMTRIRDVPGDRWAALDTPVTPWAKGGEHIVLAAGSPTYERFHGIEGWVEKTMAELRRYTDRPVAVSDKETPVPLSERIRGAHALVTHGSNAAVEAAIMGCPVFVHESSAAALVGATDLSRIESPCYPDRTRWLNSLAYCQFNETELVDGTLWRLIE